VSEPDFSWHPEPELVDVRDATVSRDALQALGEGAWETALDYLYEHGFERAVGGPSRYEDLHRLYFGSSGEPAPAPTDPTPLAALLDEFRERLAPNQLNAWHPRAFGYFTPAPLWASIAGELLAQVVNQGVDIWHAGPSSTFVEEEVIRWLCELVGYGPGSFGLLTSGGVMANVMALLVARDARLRELRGLDAAPRGRDLDGARVYVSDQTHFSVARALSIAGFPADTLVSVPADERFRLQAGLVGEAIAADRAAGRVPFAIVGTAGTTNTGSVDAIADLADLAEREGLWLHVDAAYAGAARLSERLAGRVPALDRADSLTIDPHKWFFQALDVGGLLVRDGSLLERTFTYQPEYYRGGGDAVREPDAQVGGLDFYRLGLEGTRRWRALKLWLSWKHLGTSGLGRLVEMNVDMAAYLARRIGDSPDFEACHEEPELSVVCFRHLPDGLDGTDDTSRTAIDVHQDALQAALEASGRGFLTTTRLRGRTWLRAGILNYMTRPADCDILLEDLRRLAGPH
jgi:glutamate/tyrosine decarboxylase-like PLP-dependent enzyme